MIDKSHIVETINSYELSKVMGRPHNSVRQAIERMIVRGVISAMGPIKLDVDDAYRAIQAYILTRDDSITLCEHVNRWDNNVIYDYWLERDRQADPEPEYEEEYEDRNANVMRAIDQVINAMQELKLMLEERL